jgi:hypothetical protein
LNQTTAKTEKRQIIEHVYVINLLFYFSLKSLGFTSQNIDMSSFDYRHGTRDLFLLQSAQTGFEARPASSPVGIGSSFPRAKDDGA